MYSLLLALIHICSQYDIHSGHITISCDNKGVLSFIQCQHPYVSCSHKHHDLLHAIQNTRCSCPLSLSFQYITSHQDDLFRFEDLLLLAQLNVQADSLTKQALHILGAQQAPPVLSPLPNAGWTLLLNDQPVLMDPQPLLLDHLSSCSAVPYWICKSLLTDHLATLVDWPLLNAALSPHPPTYRMWVSKFASGHSAVGTTMAKWKQWDSLCAPVAKLPMNPLSMSSSAHILYALTNGTPWSTPSKPGFSKLTPHHPSPIALSPFFTNGVPSRFISHPASPQHKQLLTKQR